MTLKPLKRKDCDKYASTRPDSGNALALTLTRSCIATNTVILRKRLRVLHFDLEMEMVEAHLAPPRYLSHQILIDVSPNTGIGGMARESRTVSIGLSKSHPWYLHRTRKCSDDRDSTPGRAVGRSSELR